MGSSWTRARTCVPCIGWRILNLCTTREASQFLFFLNLFYLFIYFWLFWVFVSVQGPSPVVASRGYSSSRCVGPSLSRPLLLQGTGSRCTGSVVVAHGPSCSTACGIFPDQGLNLCPLHWQADSQPLSHQGSPSISFWWFIKLKFLNVMRKSKFYFVSHFLFLRK